MVEKPFRQGSWPPPDSDARPSLRAPRGGVSIRWQLLALALLAVVVIFGLGNQIATRTLEHILAVESNEEQSRRVAMLVAAFSTSNELPSQTQLDVLARASNAKLSLLSADGKVLAEAGETPAQAGSARVAEEEFTKALVRDDADVTSSTRVLEHTLMTIVKLGTREVSFLRVETPIHRADATIERFRGLTLAAALVALVLSALFIEGVVRRISADVKDLRDTAIRMARGDLFAGAAPPVPNAIPELRELGVALARVAENLSSALSQLASDRDLFGSVLDGMREGVLVLDRDGRIALANPAFRQTLLLPHTVVGKLPELAIDSPPLVEILEHAHRRDLGWPTDAATAGNSRRSRRRLVWGYAGGVRRCHRAAQVRDHAARFRGQRLARVAYTDHGDSRYRRDARAVQLGRRDGLRLRRHH